MKVHFYKTISGLVPADPESEAWYQKVKQGAVVSVEAKTVRNYKFHKKYFALLNIGYDNFNPAQINSKYGIVTKNFSQFRSDCIILAGFYETWARLDGSVRIVPKSISFAKMTEEEFDDLYSKTIDVLLKFIYDKNMNKEKLDLVVNQYLSFA